MAKNIEYRDNTNKILELFKSAKTRGLEAIGLAAEGQAKKEIKYQDNRLPVKIKYIKSITILIFLLKMGIMILTNYQ